MKECPGCAVEIDESLDRCPICGYEFPVDRRYRKWIALFLLIVFCYPLLQALKRLIALLTAP